MAQEFATPDELKYQFFPVSRSEIHFTVRAPNDAHIALTPTPEEADPMYEVFIGGWRNSKSVIRKNRTKPDVVEVETAGILSEHEPRGFWIRWANGTISVGTEGKEEPFMTHTDPELFGVKFVGFCTGWGASGNWSLIEIAVPEEPKDEGLSEEPPVTFYWEKAANGEIPQKVVAGGTDNETGDTVIVARAEHEGAIIPGKFVPSHGVTYIPWGGVEHRKEEYEILCGGEARWVKAENGEVPPSAFEGGKSETGETLYIGRVADGDKLMIGKVHPSHQVCYVPYGGQEMSYQEYEVLVS